MSTSTHETHPNPVEAPEHVHALLAKLHAASLEQEKTLNLRAIPRDEFKDTVADKFVALEQDKCQFVYQLARATGARTIVEAGTSYGVSTIYLALAALSNAAALGGHALVIGTEHEPAKAARARAYWAECGPAVAGAVQLREGDLRDTLARDLPPAIDMLLLDIWTPMALPALRAVEARLRPGALVLTDNPISAAAGYAPLWDHVRAPGSGYTSFTAPFHNGFAIMVYYPPAPPAAVPASS